MSKNRRTYRLTNSGALKLQEQELFQELQDCFTRQHRRAPSKEETEGLREAAEWVKGNLVQWRVVERAINEDLWDPTQGARALFSDG
jgi:hypothetical protein